MKYGSLKRRTSREEDVDHPRGLGGEKGVRVYPRFREPERTSQRSLQSGDPLLGSSSPTTTEVKGERGDRRADLSWEPWKESQVTISTGGRRIFRIHPTVEPGTAEGNALRGYGPGE